MKKKEMFLSGSGSADQMREYAAILNAGKNLSADEIMSVPGNLNIFVSGVSLEEVTKDILSLLNSTFKFGINPLPRLRKLFPHFEWLSLNHWDTGGLKAYDANYIFFTFVVDSDVPGVVIARRLNQQTRIAVMHKEFEYEDLDRTRLGTDGEAAAALRPLGYTIIWM
ncbi:MAG: hypothetical protein NTZ38_03625 [Candidatus Taylorbacteria bacterium]|nr:hypothetical protein [Candidatus Taylorbacteria bacterium]